MTLNIHFPTLEWLEGVTAAKGAQIEAQVLENCQESSSDWCQISRLVGLWNRLVVMLSSWFLTEVNLAVSRGPVECSFVQDESEIHMWFQKQRPTS